MLKEQNCRNLRVSTKVAKSFKIVVLFAIILLSFVRGYLKKGGRQAFCCSHRFRTAMLPTPDQAENHRFAVTEAMRRSGALGVAQTGYTNESSSASLYEVTDEAALLGYKIYDVILYQGRSFVFCTN